LALTFTIAGIVAGGCVVYLLTIVAVVRFRSESPTPKTTPSQGRAISVLKAVHGDEPELEQNLRSFFEINYPAYELLFAARQDDDPALSLARELCRQYPNVPTKILVTGEPPCPNAKVFSLQKMAAAAQHDLLVISDSDIRADQNYLANIAVEFADPRVGVVTCPYRAVPGASFWSLLEALGMNSEFWGGVVLARMLAPMDFAVGPTMAISRGCLNAVGGFESVNDYLAEDFVLGQKARAVGFDVRLAKSVVEHRIGADSFASNFRHRIRWNRSTRRSRPWGYVGQVFTNPLPWALLAVPFSAFAEWSIWLLAVCALLRFAALIAVGPVLLRDRLTARYFWLVPLQDVASLLVWFVAFFGNKITWRGRQFHLTADGRLEPTVATEPPTESRH